MLQICLAVWLGAGILFAVHAAAQDQQSGIGATSQDAAGTGATVHGVVHNAASGEPLARVLVRIDGDASAGALTDGDGRFEIPGVHEGPQILEVVKPGFMDAENAAAASATDDTQGYGHNVIVAQKMPDVDFAMTPLNAIAGQIQLSTGDPAEGISVTLLKRAVQDGRSNWQIAAATKSNSDGAYRFGELSGGVYAVLTEPAMESEPITNLVAPGSAGDVSRSGYARVFYEDARDLAGAAKIGLAGGQQTEADLLLKLEPFHAVVATLDFPGGNRSSAADQLGMNLNAAVIDAQGHALPYAAQYDATTHTVQTLVPDGTYTLQVTAVSAQLSSTFEGSNSVSLGLGPKAEIGQADFSVAGRGISNLRIPIAVWHSIPIQVSVIRSATPAAQEGDGMVFVLLSPAGVGPSAGMTSTFAQGPVSGPLTTMFTPPGEYWAHVSIGQHMLCESSFTAGGANLAREPLVVGLSGATAPLNLTLRDDCASLMLSLPETAAVPAAGEERFYTVYVIPDFDSTAQVTPQTLRPSTGGTVTLNGLTPGNYHVYTFSKPVELAYHDAVAMAALADQGQAVTLSPGSRSNLVLEAPER